MSGFWALVRKEVLEQRRTWKFLGMAGFFTALALLISIIPFIVSAVRGDPRGPEEAGDLLMGFGYAIFGLGTILTIIVAMGSLANERASGTAAMTLSKPVTRAAFVAAKFLGLVFSIFSSLAIASVIMYILVLLLYDNGGLAKFAGFIAIMGVYLVFIASITFFWSGMFRRQLVAGGLALFLFIAQQPLAEIPHTQRYWPIKVAEWGADVMGIDEEAHGEWPSLPIALASITLLSVGAWGVFRRKEL